MATIFLSYSSLDREAARRLANDLRDVGGHQVWFDEWKIQVGECIHSKIEECLKAANLWDTVIQQWKTQHPDEFQHYQQWAGG